MEEMGTTTRWEPFRRDRSHQVPAASGRYALATVQGTIVYLGLTTNLRSRMEQHLDGPAKRAVPAHGRAAAFHWRETGDLRAVERSRLNSHQVAARVWPILNKVASALQPDDRAPGARPQRLASAGNPFRRRSLSMIMGERGGRTGPWRTLMIARMNRRAGAPPGSTRSAARCARRTTPRTMTAWAAT